MKYNDRIKLEAQMDEIETAIAVCEENDIKYDDLDALYYEKMKKLKALL